MKNKTFYSTAVAVIIASALFWINMFQDQPIPDEQPVFDEEITLTMYSSEGCNCCVKWAEYLEDNGVEVIQEKVADLQAVKDEHGVPGQVSACHTAIADGYVIEGHVPVEDIRSLLAEQPDVIGVSVPGMPPNSPGMDIPVSKEYYSVLFDRENNITHYNTHN
ncbi:MAG: DUF411 domain-containing protein [Balneolaceae bacterium]